ncbi:MAG: hypothetical protein ACFFDF_00335 [Candidatus Odinarchaeota archaeon]
MALNDYRRYKDRYEQKNKKKKPIQSIASQPIRAIATAQPQIIPVEHKLVPRNFPVQQITRQPLSSIPSQPRVPITTSQPSAPISAPQPPAISQQPQYTSPYAEQIKQTLEAISGRRPEYRPETDVGLQQAQRQVMDAVSRAAARRGMLYSASNKAQLGQAALSLVPQFQQAYETRYQQGTANLYNQLQALQGLESQAYGRYQTEQELARQQEQQNLQRQLTTLGQYGQDYQAEIDRRLATPDTADDELIPYLRAASQEQMAGLQQQEIGTVGQYAQDYQAEINRRLATPDTEDDKLIPYLRMARQQKIAGLQQQEIGTIGQYAQDYQAEINRRLETPDKQDDKLIPYLKMARQQKIAQLAQGEQETQLAQQKAQQAQQEQAYKLLQQIGYATPEIAQALGIPEGTTTTQYQQTQYNIEKPYYAPQRQTANAYLTDPSFAEEINFINQNPDTALTEIQNNSDALIAKYGVNGYDDLVKRATPQQEKGISSTDYLTDPDFAEEVNFITQNPDTALQAIQSNADALIAKYGYNGYKELERRATPSTFDYSSLLQ